MDLNTPLEPPIRAYSGWVTERFKKLLTLHRLIPPKVIFVDDASTDGSVKLVKRLFEYDRRLRVILNAKNAGAVP